MIIQWLTAKIEQRTRKTQHDITKLRWKQAELEQLLDNRENMNPEEFMKEYNRITKKAI